MTEQEIPNVKDALNEYFKLKNKFENEINVNKKKIINNPTLSKREKRAEYLKLMPKCVNCRRPSKLGTIFSINFNPATDKSDSYRTYKTSCGNLVDPCNLNIEINLGETEEIDKLIHDIRNEITEYKNKIIDDKNKLLFGIISTETALENFEFNKSYINDLTSIYENYLDQFNNLTDNRDKKIELDDSIVILYENINKIKDCIKKMNENNDTQFAFDAANIYYTTVEPLLKKIRQLKYGENIVYNDDSTDTCRLIQKKYSINNLLISGYTHNVVAYDVGLKAKKIQKKKPLFILETDSSAEELPKKTGEISIVIKERAIPEPTQEIPEDEPIIGKGKDGIAWNIPAYQNLWDSLPIKLKNEFKLNIEWMKDFMYKCLNDRNKPYFNGCRLTTPPNIVIPPREMENGLYDFGISIYNKVFSQLSETTKSTYLSLYKEDPKTKVKDYTALEEALNRLVEREVDFGRGFF